MTSYQYPVVAYAPSLLSSKIQAFKRSIGSKAIDFHLNTGDNVIFYQYDIELLLSRSLKVKCHETLGLHTNDFMVMFNSNI